MAEMETLDIQNLAHKLIAITIKNEEGATPARYEQTRSAWRLLPEKANEAKYVLSLTQGVVQAVYKVDNKGWQKYNDTTGKYKKVRYFFEGSEADETITKLYLGKKIERKKGQSNPIQYLYGKTDDFEEQENDMESTENEKVAIKNILEEHIKKDVSQIILTGAPGTGKTYSAKEIAGKLGTQLSTAEDNKKYCFVQFHPSYDYTDFVEGLRPVVIGSGDNQAVTFKKIDGVFKEFCRDVVAQNKAENNKDKKFFFIIDEINRADLSNVLGELMFCLEKDKRGEDNLIKTQYSNLPTWDIDNNKNLENDCFAKGFYIPENVVIIGTMNDIDRSVESFDFALRRRFTWLEVEVTKKLLGSAFASGCYPFHNDTELTSTLINRIEALNDVILNDGKSFGLNKHYFISQGHFNNIPDAINSSLNEICQYVWTYRLKSLLEEYVRGESQEKINTFIGSCENAFIFSTAQG